MALNQLFKVATEFRFEIGGALLSADALTSKVEDLSQAATDAEAAIAGLAGRYIASFSGAGTGVLGLLSQAAFAADKFKRSQIAFSTILAINKQNLVGPVDSFNDRLKISSQIMDEIRQKAVGFGLPASELLDTTKLLSPVLLQEGVAGRNLNRAIDFSRFFLKAAPVLGVNPGEAQGQLVRSVTGQASGGDPLFRRLLTETNAFRGAGIKDAKGFNSLGAVKRFELLNSAMEEFASQTNEVTANTNTLTQQLVVMRDALGGVFSIFRPLGDVILKIVVPALKEFNRFLTTTAADGIRVFSKALDAMIGSPEKLATTLLTLQGAFDGLDRSIRGSQIFALAVAVPTVLKHVFGFSTKALFMGFAGGLTVLGGIFVTVGGLLIKGLLKGLMIFMRILPALTFAVSSILVPMAAFLAVGQAINRAIAIAKVNVLKQIGEQLPSVLEKIQQIGGLLVDIGKPFFLLFETLAQGIAKLFEPVFLAGFKGFVATLNLVLTVLNGLKDAILQIFASINGAIFGVLSLFDGDTVFKSFGEAFDTGFRLFLESINGDVANPEGSSVAKNVTNIGKVEIRNDFKEQMEPDRVAFSIQEQLMKAAQNPTQARGRTFNRTANQGAF